jgi:hypothetical protein
MLERPMNVRWEHADGEHRREIQTLVQVTLDVFDRLGDGASHAVCETRRAWLLTQVSAAWLAPDLVPSGLTAAQAAAELAQPFAQFRKPELLTVRFVDHPIQGLGPTCPMGTWGGTSILEIFSDAIDQGALRAANDDDPSPDPSRADPPVWRLRAVCGQEMGQHAKNELGRRRCALTSSATSAAGRRRCRRVVRNRPAERLAGA